MDTMARLGRLFREKDDIAVAFSGGVDSTLVAHGAISEGSGRTIGIMIVNPTIADSEVVNAREVAKEIGLDLHLTDVDVTGDHEFLSNGSDRCGRCRSITYPVIIELARSMGFNTIADGANIDDLDDHRPGMKVSTEMGIWHPLIEAGIGKRKARAILKGKTISVHDRASTPCLATRVPPDQPITLEKLKLIEDGEKVLEEFGLGQVRFRLHETVDGEFLGIVEVDEPLKAINRWDEIISCMPKMKIFPDPKGYRQGSLNRTEDP